MVKRAKRTKLSKRLTAIEALRQLRTTFIAMEKDERSALWDVLTALRGCDLDANDTLKYATTAIIRTAVFGNVRESLEFHRAMFTTVDTPNLVAERTKPYEEVHGTYHYYEHMKWAFAVLGLKWNEDNGEIKLV